MRIERRERHSAPRAVERVVLTERAAVAVLAVDTEAEVPLVAV